MNCAVIRDLIPLYIDECCSEESANMVKEHIAGCPHCQKLYETMKAPSDTASTVSAPIQLRKINDWKASVLQSVLLLVSFAVITIGVALEAATPSGFFNGYWAVSLVIPATGLLLSLANWYFVRLYKSRRCFSVCSLFITLGITVCAYVWAGFHYEFSIFDFVKRFESTGFFSFFDIFQSERFHLSLGIFLTTICCALSKVLSNRYAVMLGKD